MPSPDIAQLGVVAQGVARSGDHCVAHTVAQQSLRKF